MRAITPAQSQGAAAKTGIPFQENHKSQASGGEK